MDAHRLQVLLVSSRDDDLDSTRELLAQLGVGVDLHLARDGAEGVQFLANEGPYTAAAAPDFVLLDLGLPNDGAVAVLEALRDGETPARAQVLAIIGENADADGQLEAIEGFPIHDTVQRPLSAHDLQRAVAYFGEL